MWSSYLWLGVKEADTTDETAEKMQTLGDGEGGGAQVVTHVT